jgi:hypothetical protein
MLDEAETSCWTSIAHSKFASPQTIDYPQAELIVSPSSFSLMPMKYYPERLQKKWLINHGKQRYITFNQKDIS